MTTRFVEVAGMLTLAERCEKAAEPDRELDLSIWRIIDPEAEAVEAADRTPLPWLRRYTASLDAAMTLVPKGFAVLTLLEAIDRCQETEEAAWKTALPRFVTAAAIRASSLLAGEIE